MDAPQEVDVPQDHRTLGGDPEAETSNRGCGFEKAAGHAEIGFAGLIGIGRGAQGHELAPSRDGR